MTWRELITKLGFNVDLSGMATYDKAIQDIQSKTANMYAGLNKMADGMISLGTKMSVGLSLPIAALGTVSVMASSKVEQTRTTFSVMMGDAKKADALLADLFKFEAKTPFNLEDVLGFANTLVMMKIPLEDMTKTMTMLGEATGGKAAAVEGVLAQLFQVKNLGYASMQDIKPMTNWGVPIIEALSKVMNTDAKGVMKAISKQQVSYDILMRAMTQIGQDRTGLMEKQSQTINGLMSTIQSGIFKLRLELGDLIVKEFKLQKIMKAIIAMLDKMVTFVKNLSPFWRKTALAMLVFVAAAGPVILALGLILKTTLGIVVAMTAWKLLIASGMIAQLAASVWKVVAAMGILAAEALLVVAIFALVFLAVEDIVGYFTGKDSLIIPAWKKIFSDLMDWLGTTWYGRWGDFLFSVVKMWIDQGIYIVQFWIQAWKDFFSWYTNNPVVKFMMGIGAKMAQNDRRVEALYGTNFGPASAAFGSNPVPSSMAPQINVTVGSLSVPVTGGMGVPWRAELQQNAAGVVEKGIIDQIKEAFNQDLFTATRR
jgi:tape measure domain-containing protein